MNCLNQKRLVSFNVPLRFYTIEALKSTKMLVLTIKAETHLEVAANTYDLYEDWWNWKDNDNRGYVICEQQTWFFERGMDKT